MAAISAGSGSSTMFVLGVDRKDAAAETHEQNDSFNEKIAAMAGATVSARIVVVIESISPGEKDRARCDLTRKTINVLAPSYVASLKAVEDAHNSLKKQSSLVSTREGAPFWKAVAYTDAITSGSRFIEARIRQLFDRCCVIGQNESEGKKGIKGGGGAAGVGAKRQITTTASRLKTSHPPPHVQSPLSSTALASAEFEKNESAWIVKGVNLMRESGVAFKPSTALMIESMRCISTLQGFGCIVLEKINKKK